MVVPLTIKLPLKVKLSAKILPVKVGDALNTTLPVPVEPVTPVPPLATGNVPVTPEDKGKPVAFVKVPEVGVPNAPFNNTGAPAEPVLTANAVAIPVPSPLTPVLIGNPVPLVNTIAEGVPRAGVVKTGLVDNTTLPVPVEAVTPVPPLATDRVPVVPSTIGSPVALIIFPD